MAVLAARGERKRAEPKHRSPRQILHT